MFREAYRHFNGESCSNNAENTQKPSASVFLSNEVIHIEPKDGQAQEVLFAVFNRWTMKRVVMSRGNVFGPFHF